ncbi:TonB-dependent receptor plug domain-containing protein [Pedobacter miscanthi]|uniref:TonB-dependent receptor plug domain-containing protein n=1 Tax=Pedobacter miscanthi TaxID=2259170 RepID=A0A366KZ67_9SPHI|nr:TonB-dependent receptor plug domain-containing protein [Pedobacter miscanthi]RBQ06906.1 hypothetical protein DRW42_11800 [Pedobacter miscanthi]
MKNFLTFTMMMGISLVGFAQKADSTKTAKITLRGIPVAGAEPLVVIDGNKQYIRGASTLSEINQDNIESLTVLKDSSAIAKYGPDGFAGVIEVRTKNNPLVKQSSITVPKQSYNAPLKGKVAGFSVRPQSSSITRTNSSFSVSKKGIKLKNGKDAPLYIIDGEEASGIENIDNNNIESVTVLKDASAVSEYGEKGKNGVIIIATKKAKASPKKN